MASAGSKAGTGALSGAATGTAILPGWGSAIGGVAGGLMGFLSGDDGDPNESYAAAMRELNLVDKPDLVKLANALTYQQYNQGQLLSPEVQAKLAEEYAPAIQANENAENKQRQLIQQQALEQLASSGMGPQEKLAMFQASKKAAQDAQARNASFLQNSSRFGSGLGGATLAAQLASNQGANSDEYENNMRAAAMAAENRRAAIGQAAAGASNIRSQDYATLSSNTEALRRKQEFDVMNSRARQMANAQARTQANQFNINNANRAQFANVEQNNELSKLRGYGAAQQMYENQLKMATAKGSLYTAGGDRQQKMNENNAQNTSNMLESLGKIGGGLYSKYGSSGSGTDTTGLTANQQSQLNGSDSLHMGGIL